MYRLSAFAFARGDHHRREGVPALVEGDRREPRGLPCLRGVLAERVRDERVARGPPEHEPVIAARPHPMLDQDVPQDARHGHRTASLTALRGDFAFHVVPAVFDAQDPSGEVDVLPAQRPEFAAAQAGVHRRRPRRAFVLRQRFEQRRRFDRVRDPVPT